MQTIVFFMLETLELLCRWATQQAKQYRWHVINGVPKKHTWWIFPYSWWKHGSFFPPLILFNFHSYVTETQKAPGTTVTLCYPQQQNEERAERKAFRCCNFIQLPHAGHVVTFKYCKSANVQHTSLIQTVIQDMAAAQQLHMLLLILQSMKIRFKSVCLYTEEGGKGTLLHLFCIPSMCASVLY